MLSHDALQEFDARLKGAHQTILAEETLYCVRRHPIDQVVRELCACVFGLR